jgi:hypothetical protein
VAVQIQIRRDTADNWVEHDPILAQGEFGYEIDTDKIKIGDGIVTWNNLPYHVGDVKSVSGKTGHVTLDKQDVGLGNVDNTSDSAKPISTATQTALNTKVDKVAGKGLSTEDYTTAEKTKLSGIATGATANSSDATLLARANHTGTQSADTITDGTTNKAFTATEKTKLSGVATGATANDTDANLKNRANHTGTQSADTITDGATNKAFTAAEKTKLSGIAIGATANDTDANLKNRANHTGTQTASTISDFNTAADARVSSGISTHVAASDPHAQYQKESEKGSANGYAELDATGKVPSGQLPSFVDDVIEFANYAALPATGETGKIYVVLDNNITYRWSGSAYVEISSSLALGETSTTAYRGDRGKTAYDHTLNTNNPHGVTKAQVGLGNVSNLSPADMPVSTATQTALDGKANFPNTDSHVPVRDGSGAQSSLRYTSGTTGYTIGFRTADGQIGVGAPTDNTHATTKAYVDAADAGKQNADATLTALAAHNTNGILTQTAADTFAGRTITGTANQVTVTNGNGVAGNPTLSLPQNIHTGASPTFAGVGVESAIFSPLTLRRSSESSLAQGFRYIKSRGTLASPTGVLAGDQIARFMATGYIDDNTLPSADTVEDFLTVEATENFTATAKGRSLSLKTVKTGETVSANRILLNASGNIAMYGIVFPATDSTYTLGTSSLYWKETYTDKLFLNSTATLDGSTAGAVNLTGEFNVNGVKSIYIPDQTSFSGSMFFGNGGRNLSYVSGTDGRHNSAMGRDALLSNTTGSLNNAMGYAALKSNTTGLDNNAMGYLAMADNTIGHYNSAQGNSALRLNTTGSFNSALGLLSLYSNNGSSNSGLGTYALYANTTGSNNSAVGSHAGRYIADGSTANAITNNSVFIGNGTKALANNQTNQTVIGHNAIGNGSNTVTIGNSSVTGNFFSGNIESTTVSGGVILKSPDGTRYKLTIANGGTVTVSAA